MRIGIDARSAVSIIDGIGRYALELVRAFSKRKEDHEFVILKHPSLKYSFEFDSRFREIVVPFERYGLREQIQLPGLLTTLKLDIFHSLHFTLPIFYDGIQVVTVADIMPVVLPYFFGKSSVRAVLASQYFKFMVPLALRKSTFVVVNSDTTKRDIIGRFNLHEEKFRKIYQGLDHIRTLTKENDACLNSFKLARPYVVTITNFRPYKNIPALVRAFVAARRELPDLKLAIMGENIKYMKALLADCPELRSEGVCLLGYVPDDDMRIILASANAFVFPSLYEGFGLPILESMAVGTPVITSNTAAMPETGGDAAMYVDPNRPEEIARAILNVCNDDLLSQSLRERGLQRSAEFTWDRTADLTLRVYEAAMKLGRGSAR